MPEPRFALDDVSDRAYSADSSFHRRTLFDSRGTVLRKLWAAEQKIAQHAEEIRRAQEQAWAAAPHGSTENPYRKEN